MQLINNKDDYNRFREFLQQACGILLGENKEYLVNSRLKPVIERHGLTNLGDLVAKLNGVASASLREEVIDAMTTNETLWFRDLHPFRILQEKLFAEFSEKARGGPLRIWSAACSTGQEPYSIAITAEEFKQANPGKPFAGVRVTATDISSSVLATARSGTYEMLALGRGMSDQRLQKHFSQTSDKSWQIDSKLKMNVDFKALNLLENYSRLGTNFDVIFCRNVLIYFSSELKLDILSRMHQILNPGGYLILGASESLNGLSDKFDMVQCHPGIIYRAK